MNVAGAVRPRCVRHTAPIESVSRRRASRLAVALRSTPSYSDAVSRTIEQRELRNDNAKVIEALTAGETFVVTRNGEPVAELRPLQLGRRRFMSREELAVLARTHARIDRDQLRADLDDVSTTNAEPHSMTGARHRI